MARIIRIGTCHFASYQLAVQYYGAYLPLGTADLTRTKIKDGVICIGRPDLKEGEMVELDGDGRYVIIATEVIV